VQVLIVSPAPAGSRVGNRVTALRFAGLLRRAGHRVRVRGAYEDLGEDLLIALHARKSAPAIEEARRAHPGRPIVLVLTGTDVYGDIGHAPEADRSLELADRLVILQPRAAEELPQAVRARTRLILQSAKAPPGPHTPDPEHFDVCVLAHLRAVKDPLLAARAARGLPPSSRIRIRLVGGALDESSRAEAQAELARNPRLEWLGALPRGRALQVLASSRLLVLSSRNEGGPAAVTEAIACRVPVLSTRIPATEGLLGADHPGLYPPGDEAALRELLERSEREPKFYERLRRRSLELLGSVDPAREERDLIELIAELTERR